MSVKTIVVAGPPSAGKGTLLSELKRKGGTEQFNIMSASSLEGRQLGPPCL